MRDWHPHPSEPILAPSRNLSGSPSGCPAIMPTSDERPPFDPPLGEEPTPSDEALAWFARLRSGRLSPEERREFDRWRQNSPGHARAFDEVCELWDDPALKAAALVADERSPFLGSTAPPRRRRLTRMLQAAAVAALVIGLGLQLDLPTRLTADQQTAAGERRTIQLPDRSTVTLNTDSALAVQFNAATRRVRLLKGEAWFQVQPEEGRAFIVESGRLLTRAVGTEFLVREERQGVRVTVVEGMVELAPNGPAWAPLRVEAGRQVSVDAGGPGPVREADLSTATAWLKGRLVVDNVRLGDLVGELRRYHAGAILVVNPSIADIKVSGSYTLADPAGVLTTLTQTLPVRMARLTNRLVILF